MNAEKNVPTGMNNILHLLMQVGYGGLVDDANEQVADVVAALEKRAGKGTITIKLEMERSPDNPRVDLSGGVTSTIPKGTKRDHVLYIGKDGGLSQRDPQQPELPMAIQEQEEAAQAKLMRECAGLPG